MQLTGRIAIITGAGQGLGAEIARQYIDAGASVMLCARSINTLEDVKVSLKPNLKPNQKIEIMACDVSDTQAVDQLVCKTLDIFGDLHILVNNAGVYGPMGLIDSVDWTEWVDAIKINIMGTVYPSRAVFAHMRAQRYGKIINLSGGGATNPLPRISAYATSKAAVVRFTETMALEAQEYGIDINAVAPGALNTRLMKQLLDAGPEKIGTKFYEKMQKVASEGGTPLSVGAKLCVYLGSSGSDGITGKLISAVWDPWQEFQKHRKDLDNSEVYTLRRIVPKDRGLDWGDAG